MAESSKGGLANVGLYDATLVALAEAREPAEWLALVHPRRAIREAAADCVGAAHGLAASLGRDSRVPLVLREASSTVPASTERRVFVDRAARNAVRRGASLDASGQARLASVEAELAVHEQEYLEALDARPSLAVRPEALAGTSEWFRRRHPPEGDGSVRLVATDPDAAEFVASAEDRSAARELWRLRAERGGTANLRRLERILERRFEKARLLGFASWAEFAAAETTLGSSGRALAWLDATARSIAPAVERDARDLARELRRLGRPEGRAQEADRAYLAARLGRRGTSKAGRRHEDYFGAERTATAAHRLLGESFGFDVREVASIGWATGARTFEWWRGGSLRGRVHLDLLAREGKPSEPMTLSLRRGRVVPDGVVPAEVAVVMALPGRDAPLRHAQVVTLFHELGHALAGVAAEVEFGSSAPLAGPRDAVELVPQLVEEWAWSRPVLERLGQHRLSGERIPADVLDALLARRGIGAALALDRQLYLARLDLLLHMAEAPVDLDAAVAEARRHHPFSGGERPLALLSSWPHLVGYDGAYFGYPWSFALARAAATRFDEPSLFLEGPALSDFQRSVLAWGAARDPVAMVHDFLGHAPAPEVLRDWVEGARAGR